ncbi:hypothetical protein NDU88_001795 [Pleurodeles waltl]|uniref:Uncharacterized protein n=1 Tax=Pleurodeles waltl TaxID=8319 RepID=A0AAV7VXF8_PLEWA|nr:hypothetical protein NDU88_001795 [Pleurodeles waltl]
MTDWVLFEEEEYGRYDEDGQFLGDSLSEAINASVQQSVSRALEVSVPQQISQALVVALKPFMQQLEAFAEKQNLVPFQKGNSAEGSPSLPSTSKDAPSAWPHDGVMATLQQPSADDHQYCSVPSDSSVFPRGVRVSSDSDPSESDSSHSGSPLRKRQKSKKSVSSKAQMDLAPPSNPFQFNPEDIVHPRSADWAPAQEVAEYLHGKLRRSFDKEVRNRLQAECPRPELPDKVAEMHGIDASMLTFLTKFAKDPKKGIDRAWRSCQDKLLDLTGPLAKILEMALKARETGVPIDPHILAE